MRSPKKLDDLLKTRDVSAEQITKYLTVIQGNSKDPAKVTEALMVKDRIAHLVISAVGGVPVFKPNPLRPTLDDPTICQDTVSTVLTALRALRAGSRFNSKKPIMAVISTTGISDYGRDIPLAMVPLYYWLLPVPHRDKKRMEKMLVEEVKDAASSVLQGFIAVRPSLLTKGTSVGSEAIRAAVESEGKVAKAAVGYTISREDVGGWIFERLVEDKLEKRSTYLNHSVAITS